MPLVSVIVPTHNRARYAIQTIRAVLAASPEIEVVVSDTSETDSISPEFTNPQDLNRIKFLRPNITYSVVDNFNFALKAATGEYLVFIGDDDFVSSKLMEVARWAKRESIDSVKFTFPALYYWNDFTSSTRWKAVANTISISPFTGKVKNHDSKLALKKALKNLGGGVYEMPRAYAGMLSQSLAKKIQSKYGDLFGGVSPDIFSAALISEETKNCFLIDFPVVIPGASGASTSGQSAAGRHVGGLRDNPHIGAFKNLIWDNRIPEFYGVQTVWAFSLLKAIELIPSRLEIINFEKLYVKCLIHHRHYLPEIGSAVRVHAKKIGWSRTIFSIFFECASESIEILTRVTIKKFTRQSIYSFLIEGDLADSFRAFKALENHLEKTFPKLVLDTHTKSE